MHLFNALKIAWKALMLNKVRSFLTMLGIIIGVASVIAMLAIGEGSKASIKSQISNMGANMITIRPGSGERGGVRMGNSSSKTLTLKDYETIRENASYITNSSPQVNGNGQAINGMYNWPTSIYGVNPEYLSVRTLSISSGSMFNDADVRTSSKVVVIGQTVANNLFPNGEDPLGKTIRFNKIPFKIIGVLAKKGESNFGQDQDDVLLAPYTSVQKRVLAISHIQSIVVSAQDEQVASAAVAELTGMLRNNHQLKESEENDFNIFSQDELISTFSATSELLTILLVAIASISLLVGGIGIMNIMYVSVKERTREIGLRMAVGACEFDILMQFLTESILISITGGLLGVLLGVCTTIGVSTFLGWPTSITAFSIVISFLVCTFTGVFFGCYPARKAAQQDPIVALRYE